ncbi:hypothetical protein KFU94_42665 [Chloroflexi bacterium TSY]|nr:hypothetical protein [Chloroflexi bacterium TSY]
MAPNCDSRTLYTLVTGSNLNDVYDGFRRLGECLLPIARHQLNSNQYDDMIVEDCVQEALESIWDNLEKSSKQPGYILDLDEQDHDQ